MKEFRLPRKEKKVLKKDWWLYPPNEKGDSLMARPTDSQEDYDAMRRGILRKMFDPREVKVRAKKQAEKLDPEIYISDEQLKEYVDDLFREDLRSSAYRTFLKAKNSPKAVQSYFNFVNAYNLYNQGERSYGNICCLALELAEKLLREENSMRKKRK